jgi:hypothetical protein
MALTMKIREVVDTFMTQQGSVSGRAVIVVPHEIEALLLAFADEVVEACAQIVERWRETPGLTHRIVAHGSSIHVPDGEAIAARIRQALTETKG